jgi:CRISPR-associated protein Cas1
MVKDGRIVYLVEFKNGVDRGFNVPDKNTAFLLLGRGTSITDGAVRMLAESGVQVGFCGSGGSPLLAGVDVVFLSPQSEYRPTEYMQAWMRLWLNEPKRLEAAKQFLRIRRESVARHWETNDALRNLGVEPSPAATERFLAGTDKAESATELLAREAEWAKSLYATLAVAFKLDGFRREEGMRRQDGVVATINSFLDHGNYLAYGYAAVALYALGISFSLPLLHGNTRRGALVFDVADLVKDALVMPLAFHLGTARAKDREFRSSLIDTMQQEQVVDFMIDAIKSVLR